MLEHLILNGRIEAAHLYHQQNNRSWKEELMSAFNKGKRKEFMKLYGLLKNQEKLEFYLRVYFLIYSIHPSLKAKPQIPEEEITAFREYLDTKGADLAKTNQFLQFYALSFVKKPLEHPSYKALFKKDWVSHLTEKLATHLSNEEKRMRQTCAKMTSQPQSQSKSSKSPQFGGNKPSQQQLKRLQQENKNMHEDLQNFRRKYNQLQKNYQTLSESFRFNFMQSQHKWLNHTRELTFNSRYLIDLIAKSNTSLVHDRKYQRIKKRNEKFQKMVKKELDQLLNNSQDLSVFDKPSNNEVSYSASVTPNVSQRNITTYVTLDEFVPTNYQELIRDFKKMNDSQKIGILQGLSWRIIKSKNKVIRRQTIIGLIVNDVLGLVNGDVQVLLFNPTLMSYVLKLFLYISEDSYGRKVLFRNSGLYKQLIDIIPQTIKNKNYQCLEIVLEILLNIWHNKQILLELINLNIIDICVNIFLQNQQIISNDQLLENIATMLLNATATDQGLESFQYQIDIFYYLCQAFKQANDTNRNLIGAIIYALLGRRNLWKLAHEAKLPNFINDLIKIDQRSNKQQLKLIQVKLHSFEPGKTIPTNEYEEEESIDSDLEEENFQRNQDQLTNLEEYIKGHDMLAAKYPLKHKKAQQQLSQINKIMNENRKIIETLQDFPQAMTDAKKQPQQQKKLQKLSDVKLPEIHKKKKQSVQIYNPKAKPKPEQQKQQQYYAYRSPNYKQSSDKKNIVSMQAESFDHFRQASQQRKKGNSFEQQPSDQKRSTRVQTAKQDPVSSTKKEEKKKRSSEKQPQYRIKKSSSVQKGLGVQPHQSKKQLAYETNKNSSNTEYRSIEGMKSPPLKKNRDDVLRQLNQELRAGKRMEERKQDEQQRKISSKYISAQSSAQRQNTQLKKNNYVATEQDLRAFQSKPKIRRTPPKDDE